MPTRDRQRRVMLGSIGISVVLHVALLSLMFYAIRAVITPQGAREQISETTTISVQRRVPTPPVRPRTPRRHVRPAPAAARPAPRHELARQVTFAPPQPPQRQRATIVSVLARDRAQFANEVAQLNKGDDPRAIPTIDPASAQSASKSYAFDAHSTQGDQHGNGIISPVRSWQDRGQDCYYARYTYTYPSGAMEDGNIVWPVCFDPASDPFHEPPHPMPFPLPVAGYELPKGTQLPPLEKSVYDRWAAGNPSP